MIFLLACATDPATKSPPDETSTYYYECPNPGGIVVEGDPVPGQTLHLSFETGSAAEWTVPVGSVDAEGSWVLPSDLAKNGPEELMVKGQPLLSPDCPTPPRTLSVMVDWPEAARVLVLYNPSVEGSESVADAYADFRSVPAENLCAVSASNLDVLPDAEFDGFLSQVLSCLDTLGDHIHYIVPVYGVPYKIEGHIRDISGSGVFTTTSLDALLFLGSSALAQHDGIYNPLWQTGDSKAESYAPYVPFGSWQADQRRRYYLVTRIDGADAAAALALIERTRMAETLDLPAGTVYVDGRFGDTPPVTDEAGSYEAGEWNMWGTRSVFEADGRWSVVWDGNEAEFGTAPAPETAPDALYYAGWYSFYHYNDVFTWAPGAIGGHLDSCSACDIRSSGTWAGGALQRGITATFGAVNEPYVAGMPEYDQFFLYLLQGGNFAEAAYESTWLGAWMMVWVGDPLYRPFVATEP